MLCTDCDHVDPGSQKQPWYRWTCLKSPKRVPIQFVVEDPWLTEAPHRLCKNVNTHGECEMFEPRKEPT